MPAIYKVDEIVRDYLVETFDASVIVRNVTLVTENWTFPDCRKAFKKSDLHNLACTILVCKSWFLVELWLAWEPKHLGLSFSNVVVVLQSFEAL